MNVYGPGVATLNAQNTQLLFSTACATLQSNENGIPNAHYQHAIQPNQQIQQMQQGQQMPPQSQQQKQSQVAQNMSRPQQHMIQPGQVC